MVIIITTLALAVVSRGLSEALWRALCGVAMPHPERSALVITAACVSFESFAHSEA